MPPEIKKQILECCEQERQPALTLDVEFCDGSRIAHFREEVRQMPPEMIERLVNRGKARPTKDV